MRTLVSDYVKDLIHKMDPWVSGIRIVDNQTVTIWKEGTPEEIKKIPELIRTRKED